MPGPAARLNEAFDHLRSKRFAEARATLEQLVNDELADAVVYETLGDVCDKLGDEVAAVDAWRLAASLWLSRQQVKRARGLLELLLILRPDDVDANELLASLPPS
jgi:Flp pilus assembly protein TadD